MTHCFLIGSCISGSYTVQISNDGGSTFVDVTFATEDYIRVSNEVEFPTEPTGQVVVKLTMQKGTKGFNPMLASWGVLWKNE